MQTGLTAQGYFDEEGNWVPNLDLIGLDAEGRTAPTYKGTTGVPQPLRGPVPPESLLDLSNMELKLPAPEGDE